MGRAQLEEEGAVEATLVWRWRHLQCNGSAPLDTAVAIELRRVLAKELGNDQRLADVGCAVHHHARHALSLGRLQQPLEPLQGLGRPGIVDPAVALERLHALRVVQARKRSCRRMQMGHLRCRHHQISTLKASTGLL